MVKKNGGFTLIEILIVAAIVIILAGIVFIAVSPAKKAAAMPVLSGHRP